MPLIRVLVAASVTLSHTFYVDETPTDASGAVAVTVKRLDGSAVVSGNATSAGSGRYTYVLPGQPLVDALTVDWSGTVGGGARTERDMVEVVGGYLFGLAEARAQPPPLDANRFPTATLAAKRIEVEQECEDICQVAFVPRFCRVALDGSGTDELVLPDVEVRALRAVSVSGTPWAPADVAAVGVSDAGVLTRPAGVWARGQRVLVEYEHGMDYPPEYLRMAAMLRLRSRLTLTSTGIPDRAVTFTVTDGGTYRLSMPGRKQTGVPEVDAAYARATVDAGGFA